MSFSAILSSGMQSMQASLNRTAIAGSQISGMGKDTDNAEMAASMVGLRQANIDAKAAANVIKAADGMLGTMLDLRA